MTGPRRAVTSSPMRGETHTVSALRRAQEHHALHRNLVGEVQGYLAGGIGKNTSAVLPVASYHRRLRSTRTCPGAISAPWTVNQGKPGSDGARSLTDVRREALCASY